MANESFNWEEVHIGGNEVIQVIIGGNTVFQKMVGPQINVEQFLLGNASSSQVIAANDRSDYQNISTQPFTISWLVTTPTGVSPPTGGRLLGPSGVRFGSGGNTYTIPQVRELQRRVLRGSVQCRTEESAEITLEATNAQGTIQEKKQYNVLQFPTSGLINVSYINNPLQPVGITARFRMLVFGSPRPVIAADQGIGTITDRHLTKNNQIPRQWSLDYSHYFGVSGTRTVTFTVTNSQGTSYNSVRITVP